MAPNHGIGTSIRRARERKRWTQRQLAEAVGVDRKTVDNWENGRSRPRSSVGALERVLGPLDATGPPKPEATAEELQDRLDSVERALELALRRLQGDGERSA